MLKKIMCVFPFFLLWPAITYGQTTVNAKPLQNQVLNCSEVRSRVNQMLDLHYSYKEFNEELSQRTFHKLFDNLDHSKIFFTALDVNNFKNLKSEIGKKIESNKCDFLFDIYNTFKIRVKNRVEKAKKILNYPLVLNPHQTMETGKKAWAQSEQELDSRLTKKIIFQFLTMKEDNSSPAELEKKIENSYVRLGKRYANLSQDKLYSILLNSFAESLDPHSSHMLPADQDSFTIHISNKLEGIGAQLQEEDGIIVVKSLVPGGVAQKDGRLKINDKLIAVDAGSGAGLQDLSDVDVDGVVDLIRGRKGTNVTLVVLRKSTSSGNEKMNIILTRDEINLQDENVQSALYNYNGEHIGVIKIPTFYTDLKCKNKLFARCQGVAFDTERELKKFAALGVEGVLIDLRNDGGGDFPESIKLASLFIPHGAVVQTVDKNKYIIRQDTVDSSWVYKGPLIVLINRYSASASEIFAGAIQDYARGIIVGDDHSYGKATVQIVQEIPGTDGRKSDGALKVTQNKFYRPGGTSNQRIGVRSDILDQSVNVAYDIGEENLDYALPRDIIDPARGFKAFQDLTPLIAKLKQLSAERVDKNVKYKELLLKIEKIKSQKNKLLPLTPANIKSIEDWQNAEEQINTNANADSKGDAGKPAPIIKPDDIQLMEALAITGDSIKLCKTSITTEI